jgi:hypothetical protein
MPGWPPRCELVVFPAAGLPRSIARPDPAIVRALTRDGVPTADPGAYSADEPMTSCHQARSGSVWDWRRRRRACHCSCSRLPTSTCGPVTA